MNKPFFPYLRRHIGISEKARQLPDHSLRLFSGWTKSSKMPEIYTHELGDEITNQILQIEGFSTRSTEQNDMLKAKACPSCGNCSDNKPDAKFCTKCKMVLSYDGYTEAIENKSEEIKIEMESLRKQVNENTSTLKDVLDLMRLKLENDTTQEGPQNIKNRRIR